MCGLASTCSSIALCNHCLVFSWIKACTCRKELLILCFLVIFVICHSIISYRIVTKLISALEWTISLYSFIYTDVPTPTVVIVVEGCYTLGRALSLTCVVDVVDRLVVPPLIVWEKYANNESVCSNTISVNSSRNGNNSTLSFPSLRISDAGLYTCRAFVAIDSIDVNVTAEDTQNIIFQCEYI